MNNHSEALATRAERISHVLKNGDTVPTERVIELLDNVAAAYRQAQQGAQGEWHSALVTMTRERDGWSDEAAALAKRLRFAQADNDLMRAHADKNCWFWQGDGYDHLESMSNTLVVCIHANDLRALVAAAPTQPAPADEYTKALDELAAKQGMTTEQAMRAAIRLYQAERLGNVEVVHKRDSKLWVGEQAPAAGQAEAPRHGAVWYGGSLVICEEHDREPCPHDPARRCKQCPGTPLPSPSASARKGESGAAAWRVWICPEVMPDGTVGGHWSYSTIRLGADYEPMTAAMLVEAANAVPRATFQPHAPEVVAQPVTDAMVAAYLKAVNEYWRRIDAEPQKIGKWRNGTPAEATQYGLMAALAAAPQAAARAPMSEGKIDEILDAAYRQAIAKGKTNGGMVGETWNLIAARAIERACAEAWGVHLAGSGGEKV